MSLVRASKKAKGAAPMMGMMPGMMPMMPGMMGGMHPMMGMGMGAWQQQQPEAAEESEEEVAQTAAPVPPKAPSVESQPVYEDGPAHHQHQGQNTLISRSCTYVKQIGRNRLSEALELMNPVLEASYTSELSQEALLQMIWLYSRIKPAVKISDLSAMTGN